MCKQKVYVGRNGVAIGFGHRGQHLLDWCACCFFNKSDNIQGYTVDFLPLDVNYSALSFSLNQLAAGEK